MTSPVVYFIDDSATMREVIKIAFRRENLNVVACHDAASAIDLMEQNPPDVVITDVIMPEKDGYEVCQYIKQHSRFGHTPVVLMSGVVNRSVAEKAFGVKADELIRKPFQPQDLITRVRHLLNPKAPAASVSQPTPQASAALSSIFASPVPARGQQVVSMPISRPPVSATPAIAASAAAMPAIPSIPTPPISMPEPEVVAPVALPAVPTPVAQAVQQSPVQKVPAPPSSGSVDLAKMKVEVMRLQSQVKKLESELSAEREYCRALEEHIKTLQEAE